MIEIELLEISGIVGALRALRLPYGKECRSKIDGGGNLTLDSNTKIVFHSNWFINIDENDLNLLTRLVSAGDEHAKVMRGVVAYFEINAPRFWWQEFDTYRIGCEKLSSESTMHIQGKGLSEKELVEMKSKLCEGTMQKRVVMISYQTLRRIYRQRKNHRLPHWRMFCEFLKNELPLQELITTQS